MAKPQEFDLLIVGGGLVGASLAAALATPMRQGRIGSSPKPEKAIPVLFRLEDRGVNPRSSPLRGGKSLYRNVWNGAI
jgi:hypothetical protein